jgi:hypothetical protein
MNSFDDIFLYLSLGALLGLSLCDRGNTIENMVGGTSNVTSSQLSNRNGKLFLSNANEGGLFAIETSWCSFCRQLKENVTTAGLTKVYYFDATDNDNPKVKATLTQMGVSGFPAVFKIGNNGLLTKYDGTREPADLKNNFS